MGGGNSTHLTDLWRFVFSRHLQRIPSIFGTPNRTDAGTCISKKPGLLDHLVGSQQERLRDSKAKSFRGVQVDGQLEFNWLLHRKVSGPATLQYFMNKNPTAAPQVRLQSTVRHQPARLNELP